MSDETEFVLTPFQGHNILVASGSTLAAALADLQAAIQRAERAEAAWGRVLAAYQALADAYHFMPEDHPEEAWHDVMVVREKTLMALTEADLSGPPASGAVATPPIQIVRLTKTTQRRPAQWEGRLSDGRDLYTRFRDGEFTAYVGPNLIGPGYGWEDKERIVKTQDANTDAGDMTTAEMLARLPDWLTAAPGLSVDGDAG